MIVNDFTGDKLTIFGYSQLGELTYAAIPSPIDGFTSDFTVDSKNSIWYTNWNPDGTGILINFDYGEWDLQRTISSQADSLLLQEFVNFFQFPPGMTTPNGITMGPDQNIWIVDTASSYFFKFDPVTEEFTKYVTSIPTIDSYGNASGFIKSPISRPYWIEHSDGILVMNEQTANRIGVFNPTSETLIEYTIPSRNPHWSDCEGITNCGVAQVFGFTVDGKKIWFTEWVENNIGVVDTSVSLPFLIDTNTQSITVERGQTADILLYVTPTTDSDDTVTINSSTTSTFSDITVRSPLYFTTNQFDLHGVTETIPMQISIKDDALLETHKVLLGVYNDDIAVSQFITVRIV